MTTKGPIPEALRDLSFREIRDLMSGVADIKAERDTLRARVAELEGLLARAVKYAREDRMRTPGKTRLARVLAEAEAALDDRITRALEAGNVKDGEG